MGEEAAKPMGSGQGPVRGYMDGCFDIMHSGHFNAIRQAKAVCDLLVVGIHTDAEIEENKSMPVMKQAERYALLEHVKWIDEILHDVPYSPQIATLEKARAEFCVHGDDMPTNSEGVGAYDEMRDAGRLKIVKRTEGVSTTDLIGRLLTLSQYQHEPKKVPESPFGTRAKPDELFEEAFSLDDLLNGGDPDPLDAGEALVDKLLEAGKITSQDADELRGCMRACTKARPRAGTNTSPSMMGSPKALRTAGASEDVRTRAPVQLLASTRRIGEFSTARVPGKEDTVVYVCGTFDMFHVGHAQFLKDAKALGTFLLVGIYEDQVVSQAKGPHLPVMNLNERVLNVCAIKWVDEVIIAAPQQVTEDLIKTWNIHTVASATGHMRDEVSAKTRGLAETRFSIPKKLGIYREIPSKWPDLCHNTLVQRIIQNRELYQKRNLDRARREDKYYEEKDAGSALVES